MKILKVKSKKDAIIVSDFLKSPNAFEDSSKWNAEEISIMAKTPFESLGQEKYQYWYLVDNLKVIGCINIRENIYKSGGYYIDWFAVHKDFRRNGYGTKLLNKAEKYIKETKGRYILIETGDVDKYIPARKFYEKNQYAVVGHVKEYYYKDWGMYLFQKVF